MKIENKNIILTLLGIGVSNFGSMIFTFALSMYILDKTGSGLSFGLNLTMGILPRILIGPFIGNLADRSNKKILVIGSDIFSGILMLLLFILIYKFGFKLELIYASSFLLAVSSVFLDTGMSSAFPSIVKKEKLTKVHSLSSIIRQSINFGAPMLGGLVYAMISIKVFILINSISFILSALSEYFIDFNFNGTAIGKKSDSFFRQFREGISYLMEQKEMLTLMIFALFINFFLSSATVIMPYLLRTEFGLAVKTVGIINSVAPIGGILGGIYVGRKNLKMSHLLFRNTILLIGISYMLIAILPYTENPNFFTITLSTILFSVTVSFIAMLITIPLGVYIQTKTDREYLGRVASIFGTLSVAVVPIAYTLYGFLLTKYEAWLILALSGFFGVITAIISGFNRNIKYLGKEEEIA